MVGNAPPRPFPIIKLRRERGPLITEPDGTYKGTPYKQLTPTELGVTRDNADQLLWFGFSTDLIQITVGGVASLDELKRIVDDSISIEALI